MAWVVTLAPTLGCVTFAVLQAGAIVASVHDTRGEIDRERQTVLATLGGTGGGDGGAPGAGDGETDRPSTGERESATVEAALLGRETDARRSAATERRYGTFVIAAAALALLLMAAGSAWSLTYPRTSIGIGNSAPYGDAGAGIVLALVGFVGVLWAGAILRRDRTARRDGSELPPGSSPGPALARIDEAAGQLDRARATAGRARNAAVLAAVLIVVRLWFVPGYYSPPAGTVGEASAVLAYVALPLALAVVLWTAYRLDRMESQQTELRQWVRALARLEQAFWDRY